MKAERVNIYQDFMYALGIDSVQTLKNIWKGKNVKNPPGKLMSGTWNSGFLGAGSALVSAGLVFKDLETIVVGMGAMYLSLSQLNYLGLKKDQEDRQAEKTQEGEDALPHLPGGERVTDCRPCSY